MGFLRPKIIPPPVPVAPAPPLQANQEDTQRAAALAEEATKTARKKKGAGSTVVAGALREDQGQASSGGTPTLLG